MKQDELKEKIANLPGYIPPWKILKILALLKEAGYVKLAKDQTPPPNKYEGDIDIWQNIRLASRQGYALAQQDMLAANFKKVEEIND